ncbi:MAG: hypothetical protein LBR18_06505, partial [Tannerella sp.]|nr:hypothetical protein [Tannerella sp.]
MKETNNSAFTRRKFLKSGVALAAGLPSVKAASETIALSNSMAMSMLCNSNADNSSIAAASEDDSLYELFRNPPATAKPFVRWWWNGDKLSAKEIVRELDVMKAAGIGGVEINPIAFPGGDDLGIPSLPWL